MRVRLSPEINTMPREYVHEHVYSSLLDQKAFHHMNSEHFVDASPLVMN